MSSLPFDLERSLHQHGALLRQLARDLLRDDADADDVVQEVWLGAMQRPPRHDKAIGGWLATSLRNVAKKLRRGQRRRERREADASRMEATGDHAQLLAQEEQLQRLVAGVHALELLFREAIWRRYFEGMAPREIAQMSGEPLATVKSRLQRGLRELRAKLGEGSADWRGALTAAFGLGRTGLIGSGATTSWSGAIFMAAWTKAVVAAAIVAIGVMLWWMQEPVVAAPDHARAAASEAGPVAAAMAPSLHDRADVVATGNESQVPVVVGAPAKQATMHGRCVDGSGAPLAGCTVQLLGWEGNDKVMREWLLTNERPQPVEPAPVTTPADGTFAFTFPAPPPFQFGLNLMRDGCYAMAARWRQLEAGADVDVGDVVLRPGVRVSGRVVDGAGRPQGQVNFSIWRQVQGRNDETPGPDGGESIKSSDDGSFATRGWLMPGEYGVKSTSCTIERPHTLALSLDRPVEDVVVVLGDESRIPKIEGRVVDEAGNAITGAKVIAHLPGPPHVLLTSSRQAGSFALRGPEGSVGTAQLQVKAEGFEPSATPVAWGSRDLEVRLQPSAGLTLRVEDQAGVAVADYRVRTIPRDAGPLGQVDHLYVRAKGPFENGTVRIPDVNAGRWLVLIDFPDGSPFLTLREHVKVIAGGPNQATLRAEKAAQRLLRVTRADGTPVAGVRVQLCERIAGSSGTLGAFSPGPNTTLFRERRWLLNLHNPNMAMIVFEGTTDSAGQLMMQGPRGKDLAVRIRGRGLMPVLLPGLRLEQDGELAVMVGVGARLKGRIGPKEVLVELRRRAGLGPTDPYPEDWRPHLLLKQSNARIPSQMELSEDGDAAPYEIYDDGTFDLAGLPSGTWQLTLVFRETSGPAGEARRSPAQQKQERQGYGETHLDLREITLAEGATDQLDIELYRFLPGTLEGEVTWNGAPLQNARIRVEADLGVNAEGRPDLAWTNLETDDRGCFVHRGPAGTYRLDVLRRDASGMSRVIRGPATATIARGETTRQTFAVMAGILELKLLDASGQPVAGVEVHTLPHAGLSLPATLADGSARAELAAQTFTLRVLPKRLQSTAAQNQLHREAVAAGRADSFGPHWLEIGTAMIEAGRTTTLELRLPPEWEK